ncbi:MAG TPA: DedA family protein [Frankiaceae bacterium]|nr:DedA family protein [Frankiaceae bacterium]
MDVAELSGSAMYAVVLALVYVESGILVGFWLPGDTLLFAAGLATADPATGVAVELLAAGAAVAATLGAVTGYAIGRRLGRPYLARRYGRVLARTERFYERFGPAALVAARFVPWARTFAPVLAGAASMPYPRFAAATGLGALCWGTGLVVLGHAAASLPGLRDAALGVAVAVVALSVVVAVVGRRRRGGRGAGGGRA